MVGQEPAEPLEALRLRLLAKRAIEELRSDKEALDIIPLVDLEGEGRSPPLIWRRLFNSGLGGRCERGLA